MDSFKSWFEIKFDFTKDDILGKDMTPIWVDQGGTARLDYGGGRANFNLDVKNKVVRLRSKNFSGVHVWPRVQQLLQDLIKQGIIDATWTIDGGNISRYNSQGTWSSKTTDISNKKVGDLSKPESRLTAITQDLIFYHGTSEEDWKSIQKTGLQPLGSKFAKGGYESRAKHSGNKDLIYLASTTEGAWQYAKTRTRSVIRDMTPDLYRYIQYQSECSWPIKPIIISVTIKDIGKLRSDDDAANDLMRKWARKIWNAKPLEERKKIVANKSSSLANVDDYHYIWRETDDGFTEIMKRVPQRVWYKWLASIRRYEQVGYKGYIPPSQLKLINMCDDVT